MEDTTVTEREELDEPLEVGTVVTYQGSIGFYHGHKYTVVRRYRLHNGQWRYDLEPVKGLFGARRSSLEVD